MRFDYSSEKKGDICIFRLQGRLLEKSESDNLMSEFELALESKCQKFIVNMNEIEYMNSSGLNLLIRMLTKARNSYGELVLCQLSDRIQNLLVATKLQSIFNVEGTEAEAIEKLKS